MWIEKYLPEYLLQQLREPTYKGQIMDNELTKEFLSEVYGYDVLTDPVILDQFGQSFVYFDFIELGNMNRIDMYTLANDMKQWAFDKHDIKLISYIDGPNKWVCTDKFHEIFDGDFVTTAEPQSIASACIYIHNQLIKDKQHDTQTSTRT